MFKAKWKRRSKLQCGNQIFHFKQISYLIIIFVDKLTFIVKVLRGMFVFFSERLVEVGKNEKNNRLSLSPQDDEKLNRRDDDIIPVRNRSFSRQSNSNQECFNDPYNELGDTFAVTKRLQEIPEPLSPVDSPRSIDEAILHNATM